MHAYKSDTNIVITLHLSRDFDIPPFILNEPPPVIQALLLQTQELFNLQKHIQITHSNESIKSICDQNALQATIQAQKEFSSQLQQWTTERSHLQQEILQLKLEQHTLISNASRDLELKNQQLAGKLISANSQISQLQDDRMALETRTRDFITQTVSAGFIKEITSIKECHQRELQTMQMYLDSFRNERDIIKKASDEQLLQRSKCSTQIGQQGESSFNDLCQLAGIPIEYTGKDSHKGDFIAIIDTHRVLVEVKNYSNTVSTKEVIKFKRDMDQNKDCVIGLFTSMKTTIAHVKAGFHIEWLHDNRPVVFVSEMDKYDGLYLIEIIRNVINVLQHYTIHEEPDFTRERIETALKTIDLSLKKTTDITRHIRLYHKQTSEMFDSLEKMMKGLKDDISDSIAGLSGKSIDNDSIIEDNHVVHKSGKQKKKGKEDI